MSARLAVRTRVAVGAVGAVGAIGAIGSKARLALLALLVVAAPACRRDGEAVLLVSVTASGSPPAVAALDVTIDGPGEPKTQRYEREGQQAISFPTTLSAQLPNHATGMLTVKVSAFDAGGVNVASGGSGPITIAPGERLTVYVQLDCGGEQCVVDGGTGGNDGGPPTPSPRCGNGRVDPGETCDTAIAAGDPGACPASCDDHVGCTTDDMIGSACTLQCEHKEKRNGLIMDGCCTGDGDPDCFGTCPNEIVERGETCDLGISRGTAGACPMTSSDCMPGAACSTAMFVSAGTCAAVCVRYQIVAQADDDGCCPPGATSAVDNDCVALCGNGVVDRGERCDVGIPPLKPGACPTSCDDGNPCTRDFLSSVGCQAVCENPKIEEPLSGDGCCPRLKNGEDATRAIDTDCRPVCGNNVIEPGETCDGNCPTSCPPPPPLRFDRAGCLRVDIVGTAETCSARCVVREETVCAPDPDKCCPAGCTSADDPDCSDGCGNGGIEFTKGEVCETAAPPGDPIHCPMSCTDSNACTDDLLVSAGTCSAACMHLPTRALRPGDGCCPMVPGSSFLLDPDCAPMCGNGIVESPAERCDFAIPGSCPIQGSCPRAIGCTKYEIQGSGSACTAACVATQIASCVDNDGCCPATCTAATDSDCRLTICGNGVVEDKESCDRGITAGAPGACPRSCDDGNACTLDVASGTPEGCTRTCTHLATSACLSGDGCCPQGCVKDNDSDCDPTCGDGKIGQGETCDPPSTCPASCPDDGDPCTTDRLVGSAAACTAACRHAPITSCVDTARDSCCPTGCNADDDSDC